MIFQSAFFTFYSCWKRKNSTHTRARNKSSGLERSVINFVCWLQGSEVPQHLCDAVRQKQGR